MHGSASLRWVKTEKSSFNYLDYIIHNNIPESCATSDYQCYHLWVFLLDLVFWSCLGFCVIVVYRVALYQSVVLVSIMMK